MSQSNLQRLDLELYGFHATIDGKRVEPKDVKQIDENTLQVGDKIFRMEDSNVSKDH